MDLVHTLWLGGAWAMGPGRETAPPQGLLVLEVVVSFTVNFPLTRMVK